MDIYLLLFLPNGVVDDLGSSSILLLQVSTSFAVTVLIVLLAFCSIVLLAIFQYYCLIFVEKTI